MSFLRIHLEAVLGCKLSGPVSERVHPPVSCVHSSAVSNVEADLLSTRRMTHLAACELLITAAAPLNYDYDLTRGVTLRRCPGDKRATLLPHIPHISCVC